MEIAKARTLSERELAEELASARRHLYDLRFQLATRQLTDYSQISQTRKDIARLLTVQTERELADGGAIVMKFWLSITPQEQLKRFRAREKTPHKRHKITPEDWRNREKWGAYEEAVEDMIARTSTRQAPWTLVAANDKRLARVRVLETFVRQLDRALEG